MGRDKKIRTALRTNQNAGFVNVLSEKKIRHVVGCHIRQVLLRDNIPGGPASTQGNV